MKQGKNIVLVLSFIAIAILLYLQKCTGGNVVVKETIKYDTVLKEVKGDSVYVPQIVNHFIHGQVPPALEKWDTLYMIEPTDTLAILKDYYSFNLYSDSLKVSDTSGMKGVVYINDTISRNRIMSRGLKYNIKYPFVTKTIERTILDKRIQLYAELGLLGNTKDLAAGVETELLLKTKNDRIIGIGYETLFNGGSYFKIKYAHKISFRKH